LEFLIFKSWKQLLEENLLFQSPHKARSKIWSWNTYFMSTKCCRDL